MEVEENQPEENGFSNRHVSTTFIPPLTEGNENEGEDGRIRKAEREETKETSLWLVRCLGTGKRNGRNVHGRSMGVKRQLRAAGVGDIDVGPVTEANLSDQLLETSGNPLLIENQT